MASSKTSYQGGPFVDVLTGHGRSPLEDFKISPHNGIQKLFDKSLKGFVFLFAGNSISKLQVPNDEKKSCMLHLLVNIKVDINIDYSEFGATLYCVPSFGATWATFLFRIWVTF
jgi:hypothetical protein